MISLLSLDCVCHLLIGELLDGHGWQVVSWLEHLLLILLLQINAIVDVVLLHCYAFDWFDKAERVSVFLNDLLLIKLYLSCISRATSSSCATTWLHKVRELLDVVRPNMLDLKWWHVVFFGTPCIV